MRTRFQYSVGERGQRRSAEERAVVPVRLALQEDDGDIDLVTLNEDGTVDRLVLTVEPDGTFYRHAGGNFAGHATEENPRNQLVLDKEVF